jgi:N utilization substance protein B
VGTRREARELALQALYSLVMNPAGSRASLQLFLEEATAAPAVREFARQLVEGVTAHQEEIDIRLRAASQHWSLTRMGKVDISLLRLAVFELLYRDDIPKNVTINESIEIAKKFGTEDSPAFVNGILDEIARSLTGPEEPPNA